MNEYDHKILRIRPHAFKHKQAIHFQIQYGISQRQKRNHSPKKHLPSFQCLIHGPNAGFRPFEVSFYTNYVTSCWSNLLIVNRSSESKQSYSSTLPARCIVCDLRFLYELCKDGNRLFGICPHGGFYLLWPSLGRGFFSFGFI